MGNYKDLKNAIQQVVLANGNNEITGELMQDVLLAMINSLGFNFQFAGIATPNTNPGTPDQNIFYIANVPGLYANFGGIIVNDGECVIFKYNGTWSKNTLFTIEGGSIVVKEPYFPVNNHTETTLAISPNIYHKWGVVSSLTISLEPPTDDTITNEYIIEFTAGNVAPTISLPDNLVFSGEIKIEANAVYQISIINNLVVWSAFKNV